MNSTWLLDGKPVTSDDIKGFASFVYIITNLINGRKYIGKKRLIFIRKKRIKDSKRRKTFTKESDWETYYGSCDELAKDLHFLGKENFKREIIRLCKTNSEASYFELREQMINDVLLKPGEYYNQYAGARINRSHVLGKF